MTCAVLVYEEIKEYIETMDKRIKEEYNISSNNECPILACNCLGTDVLPFDYYTVKFGDKFMLVLSTVCRGCGGYKEISLHRELFTTHLRDPQKTAGLSLSIIGAEKNPEFYR